MAVLSIWNCDSPVSDEIATVFAPADAAFCFVDLHLRPCNFSERYPRRLTRRRLHRRRSQRRSLRALRFLFFLLRRCYQVSARMPHTWYGRCGAPANVKRSTTLAGLLFSRGVSRVLIKVMGRTSDLLVLRSTFGLVTLYSSHVTYCLRCFGSRSSVAHEKMKKEKRT